MRPIRNYELTKLPCNRPPYLRPSLFNFVKYCFSTYAPRRKKREREGEQVFRFDTTPNHDRCLFSTQMTTSFIVFFSFFSFRAYLHFSFSSSLYLFLFPSSLPLLSCFGRGAVVNRTEHIEHLRNFCLLLLALIVTPHRIDNSDMCWRYEKFSLPFDILILIYLHTYLLICLLACLLVHLRG